MNGNTIDFVHDAVLSQSENNLTLLSLGCQGVYLFVASHIFAAYLILFTLLIDLAAFLFTWLPK